MFAKFEMQLTLEFVIYSTDVMICQSCPATRHADVKGESKYSSYSFLT
jgi:hypothetical protein